MPDYPVSARAGSNGIATVRIQHNRAGVIWVVSQLSVRSSPVRTGIACTVSRNGQLMTTTSLVPSTAGGQPFYRLNATDVLECEFRNLTSGDTAYVTASYSESLWGEFNDGSVI